MSGKKERERRREERVEVETRQGEEERRQRLLKLAGLAVGIAVLVVVVLIVVTQGQGGGGDTDLDGVAEVRAELKGIPQQGIRLGDEAAPVEIVEYGDLQCPICKQFSDEVTPGLIEGPVAAGRARMEFRQWPILGDESVAAAKAALAAAEQGVYWEFVETFYANQGIERSGYVTEEFLEAVAKAAGVKDLSAWKQARESRSIAAKIAANEAAAQRLGFSGTPSFVVSGPGGEKQLSVASLEEFEAAIEEVS